jgi:hypothetical protein
LDASIALNVIQALKDIAASGKTVIVSTVTSSKLCLLTASIVNHQVTIHQPRSDIWHAIDNVMLLSGAGTMVVSRIDMIILDKADTVVMCSMVASVRTPCNTLRRQVILYLN